MIHNGKPTLDRLIVEKSEVQEIKTASGIVISSGKTHTYNPQGGSQVKELEIEEEDNVYEATVLVVSDSITSVKVGDKVLVSKYAGIQIRKIEKVYLISEKDILTIL